MVDPDWERRSRGGGGAEPSESATNWRDIATAFQRLETALDHAEKTMADAAEAMFRLTVAIAVFTVVILGVGVAQLIVAI